jgi:putative ubiquitin-RnfH superfamily antitoxin RatB of RatAB toxin-antitoxin module
MPMRIELAWVNAAGEVASRRLELPEGATLGDALAAISEPGLREGLTAGRLVAAVFGQLRKPTEALSPGDRVELLEGLRVDPKVARQRRVAVRRAQAEAGRARSARAREQGGPTG